jgi:hypothetical protein
MPGADLVVPISADQGEAYRAAGIFIGASPLSNYIHRKRRRIARRKVRKLG